MATYCSAIALKLASIWGNSASDCATQLMERVRKTATFDAPAEAEWVETALRDLTVTEQQSGMVKFCFGDRAIGAWLQSVLKAPLPDLVARSNSLLDNHQSINSPEVFYCQYAHARCASLIRHAAAEAIGADQSFPWLTEAGQGRWTEAADYQLVSAIVTAADDLADDATAGKPSMLRRTINLSQAFQTFERSSRIWGDVRTQNQPLAECRLGLVMITQRLLETLLEQGLGVHAPAEL